jgi:hypothetical protein
MNRGDFFSELKRRNVIRMAGLYLVGTWLLTQVASTLLPAFDVPSRVSCARHERLKEIVSKYAPAK